MNRKRFLETIIGASAFASLPYSALDSVVDSVLVGVCNLVAVFWVRAQASFFEAVYLRITTSPFPVLSSALFQNPQHQLCQRRNLICS